MVSDRRSHFAVYGNAQNVFIVMRIRIYKSLDRTVQVFGIRGRYLYIMAFGTLASVVISVLVGKFTFGLVGIMLFFILFFTCAMILVSVQSSLSDKELFSKIAMTKCPHGIRVKPKRILRIWK